MEASGPQFEDEPVGTEALLQCGYLRDESAEAVDPLGQFRFLGSFGAGALHEVQERHAGGPRLATQPA